MIRRSTRLAERTASWKTLQVEEGVRIPLPTRARERGQGLTEYIIIAVLIAIAAIGAYSFFGQGGRQQPAQELPGKEVAGTQDGKQGTKGGSATGESNPAVVPK
jgi:hypothetical protein